jgi:integral membrane sensor domain MASE1
MFVRAPLQLKLLSLYVGLPVIYVVTGWLGLIFFAHPPGYATPIFLPAGVAICAVCLYRQHSLPGVFLGSFLLNVLVGYYYIQHQFNHAVVGALVIAAASTVQAGVGGYWFRRAIVFQGMTLTNVHNLLHLTVLTPVVCLISASLSLSGLWALGLVATYHLLGSWWYWWVGDVIGVLIVMPWMLFFTHPIADDLRRAQIERWTRDILDGKLK